MSERQPFKTVLGRDYNALFGVGKQALVELAFATHAGITDEDFEQSSRWMVSDGEASRVGPAVQ